MLKLIFIKSLPSVPIDRLSQLPKEPGVYYACAGVRVLYVGKADNVHSRWNKGHHRLAEIKIRGGNRLHYRTMPLHWVGYFEAIEIQALKPPLNRQYPNPQKLMTAQIFMERLGWAAGLGFIALLIVILLFF